MGSGKGKNKRTKYEVTLSNGYKIEGYEAALITLRRLPSPIGNRAYGKHMIEINNDRATFSSVYLTNKKKEYTEEEVEFVLNETYQDILTPELLLAYDALNTNELNQANDIIDKLKNCHVRAEVIDTNKYVNKLHVELINPDNKRIAHRTYPAYSNAQVKRFLHGGLLNASFLTTTVETPATILQDLIFYGW